MIYSIIYGLYLLNVVQYTTMTPQAPTEAVESVSSLGNTKVAGKPTTKVKSPNKRDLECLSLSIYWESKGEGRNGMILTGLVVMNRVKHKSFPDTVCEVIKAPRAFSWYWDGKSDKPKELDRYKLAQSISKELLNGGHSGKMPPSVTFFKKCRTKSKFFDQLRHKTREGDHCFYEEY